MQTKKKNIPIGTGRKLGNDEWKRLATLSERHWSGDPKRKEEIERVLAGASRRELSRSVSMALRNNDEQLLESSICLGAHVTEKTALKALRNIEFWAFKTLHDAGVDLKPVIQEAARIGTILYGEKPPSGKSFSRVITDKLRFDYDIYVLGRHISKIIAPVEIGNPVTLKHGEDVYVETEFLERVGFSGRGPTTREKNMLRAPLRRNIVMEAELIDGKKITGMFREPYHQLLNQLQELQHFQSKIQAIFGKFGSDAGDVMREKEETGG